MVKIMGVRDLNMYDRSEIKKLDAISGNDVWMYAEDKRLETSFFDEEGNFTGSAFGLFAKGDPAGNSLIGYCSLGLADCLEINVDGYDNPSDMDPAPALLSDVYIREEYRHNGLAHWMLSNSLKWMSHDVYLQYLDDDLEELYETFGFYKIPGTNIMIRKQDDICRYQVSFISGNTLKEVRKKIEADTPEHAVELVFQIHGKNFENNLISVKEV